MTQGLSEVEVTFDNCLESSVLQYFCVDETKLLQCQVYCWVLLRLFACFKWPECEARDQWLMTWLVKRLPVDPQQCCAAADRVHSAGFETEHL